MSAFRFKNIALLGNPTDPRVVEAVRLISSHLASQGIAVMIADDLPADAAPRETARFPEAALPERADLLIAVGGDGTMLYAARRIAARRVPLVGINRGRLGFLADVSPAEMLSQLDEIVRGQYLSEQRLMLRAEIIADGRTVAEGQALNDIVVTRHDAGRMLELQTFVDGRYLNTHRGDGYIVATATGSTAYALSCGGPIVDPRLDAIVLAPISPHTLSERPILVPSAGAIELRLRADTPVRADVSCDGEVTGELLTGRTLRIEPAKNRLELIHPRGYDYFNILRGKLHWGRDHQTTGPDGPG